MKGSQSSTQVVLSSEFAYNPIPEPIGDPKEYLKRALPHMSKWQIEAMRTYIKSHYLGRFRRPRIAKYGSLNKGFTEQQLAVFMHQIDNPKHKLLFKYQAQLGLRVGEVVKVNVKDISFEERELKIFTEKARQLDAMRIPPELFRETLEYIRQFSKDIEQNEGYLFFRDKKYSNRSEPYLELNYIRRVFREYVVAAGIDQIYDVSEVNEGEKPKKLHLLTTHSLRHYAITKFARSTNGNVVLTSRFARHRDMSTTSRYINTDKKEIYDVIDAISVGEATRLKQRLTIT